MGKLDGQTALVTGSGGGIGLEIATAMLREGANVCLNDLNEALVAGAAAELSKAFGHDRVTFIAGSVADKQDATAMVEHCVQTFGTITILVNNAGGTFKTPVAIDFEDFSEEDYDLLLDVNLKGTFLVSQAAVRRMKENQYGRIVNMASMSGRTAVGRGDKNSFDNVPYAAAKGGVAALTRSLAGKVGVHGINVNAIAPGLIVSGPRIRSRLEENPEAKDRMEEMLAVNGLGEPQDIAYAAVFLSSKEARYITGALLDVNGGSFIG